MASRIVVVGGGLSGLYTAKELQSKGFDVEIIETRDIVGGISIIDPQALKMIDSLVEGLRVETEKTAVKVAGELLAISSKGVERISNAIVATGFRVKSMAELGILGDRPSGIYPFHSALDLMRASFKPGKNIVVYGLNRYSLLLIDKLLEFARRVYVVDPSIPEGFKAPDGVEAVEGRVSYVKGAHRLSAVVVKGRMLNADTLILAMFEPWNPFPELPAVGHAALEVYSLEALMDSSKLFVENFLCEGRVVKVYSSSPTVCVFPKGVKEGLGKVLVVKRGGGRVKVNDRVYNISGDYTILEIPKGIDEVVVSEA